MAGSLAPNLVECHRFWDVEPKPQSLLQHRRDLRSFARATQSHLARQQLVPAHEAHRRMNLHRHCRRQNRRRHSTHRQSHLHRLRQILHRRQHRQNPMLRPAGADDCGHLVTHDAAFYGRCWHWHLIRRRCRFRRLHQCQLNR